VSAHLKTVDPDARIALRLGDAEQRPGTVVRHLLDSQLETVGTEVAIVVWNGSPATRAALPRLAPIAPLLTGDIVALDGPAAGLTLSTDGRDLTATLRHRLLFDNRTFATFLVYWDSGAAAPSSPIDVALTLPVEGAPSVYKLTDGTKLPAADYVRTAESSRVRARMPAPDGPMLVDFNEGAIEVFAERSDVSAERQLSVEEVIARHQQQQRATTWSPRTATTSPTTGSSGRSCRFR
jgi:hypothetical protein